MKPAAIGVRAHSGWAAVVAVTGGPAGVAVIDRRRIVVTDPHVVGASQPYHFAQRQTLAEAERFLAACAEASEELAADALGEMVEELRQRKYVSVSCAILLASGRPLPSLAKVLASHSLIHTAEGEFFRRAFRQASERLGIRVAEIRERELDERAEAIFGARSNRLQREIAGLGAALGPPWTTDQKSASLAALLVLQPSRRYDIA